MPTLVRADCPNPAGTHPRNYPYTTEGNSNQFKSIQGLPGSILSAGTALGLLPLPPSSPRPRRCSTLQKPARIMGPARRDPGSGIQTKWGKRWGYETE